MREGQKIKRRKTGECKSDITALTYAARPLPQFVTGQSRSRRHAYTPPYIYIYILSIRLSPRRPLPFPSQWLFIFLHIYIQHVCAKHGGKSSSRRAGSMISSEKLSRHSTYTSVWATINLASATSLFFRLLSRASE